jgi:tetratricopeptide (TPR) repeat protein
LVLWKQGKLKDAEDIYRSLSSRYPDWWILHEHAKVLKDSGKKDEALKLMCRAAISNRGKLETMVSLLEDIGGLLKESGRYEESQAHFLLSRYIRTSQNWTLKDSLLGVLSELKKLLNRNDEPSSLRDALKICKDCWQRVADVVPAKDKNKAVRRGLVGNLSLGSQDRPFCFINMGSEPFFCLKSEVPSNIRDGSTVTFDASPSYDKKKNKESWKAINIKLKENINKITLS